MPSIDDFRQRIAATPTWLVHETDGAIVVARNMKTRRQELSKAMATLGSVGARVLGVVSNDVKGGNRSTYYTQSEKTPTRRSSGLLQKASSRTDEA